jgi:PLP dependent protein
MTDPACPDNDSAAARLSDVRSHIARAAEESRRDADDVTLIAVSKTHGAESILPLIAAGQRDFGENRVQEAAAKWPELRAAYPAVRLHMIGQLQSNKADEAVQLFDYIHSLDRPSLVTAIARAMDRAGRRPGCFLQVNLEGSTGKGGCAPAALGALLGEARAAGIPVFGLMTVPPLDREPAPWFALLAKLADDLDLPALSMGMSGDYPTAVRLGATHVRVGTALFGSRG